MVIYSLISFSFLIVVKFVFFFLGAPYTTCTLGGALSKFFNITSNLSKENKGLHNFYAEETP